MLRTILYVSEKFEGCIRTFRHLTNEILEVMLIYKGRFTVLVLDKV